MDVKITKTGPVRSVSTPAVPAARPAEARAADPSDRVTLGTIAGSAGVNPQGSPPFDVRALGARLAGLMGGIPATIALGSVTFAAKATKTAEAPPDPHRALADALGGYERRVTAHEERLAKLPVSADLRAAVTLAWADILQGLSGGSDAMLPVLDAVATASDVPTAIAGVRTLAQTTPDAALTARDTKLALDTAAAHPAVPAKEIFDALAALRKVDVQRGSYDPRYGPLDAALALVTAHPAADTRANALQQVVSLHAGGRSAQQAVRWHQAIEALPVTASERADVRAAMVALLPKLERRSDESVCGMLEGLAARPAAMTEFRAFQSLCASVSPATAAADLAIAQKTGDARPAVPLDERIGHIVALRKTDPQYPSGSLANIAAVLEHVCAAPDAAARRQLCEAVIGLQGQSHNAEKALEVQRKLEALKCPPADAAAVRADYLQRRQPSDRNQYIEQRSMVAALDVIAARLDARDAYRAFGALTPMLETAQALADLKSMVTLADSTGVSIHEIGEHAEALRKQNIPQGDRGVRDLGPTLAHVVAAPTPAERLERRGAVLGLQVRGRSCDQARELDSRLRALQLPAPERDALRGRLVATLGKQQYWRDDDVRAMLDDLAPRARPVEEYEAWEALLAVVDARQAEADLRDVQSMRDRFPSVPFAEMQAHAVALRKVDQAQSATGRLAPALASVLTPGDPAERDAKLARVVGLAVKNRSTERGAELEQRLAALGGSDEDRKACRASLTELVALTYRDADARTQQVLDSLAGRADARHALAAYGSVVRATSDADVAMHDVKALLAVADARGVPVEALGRSLSGLRAVDPNIKRDYERKFTPLDDVLAHIADGPDAAAREARHAEVLSLQKGWRDAPTILPFQTALRDIGGTTEVQARLRATFIPLLEKHRSNDDATLLKVLTSLKGRAEAPEELEVFVSLGSKAYAAQTLRDLRGLQAVRDSRPDLPWSTLREHALGVREAESNSGQGNAAEAVAHIVSFPDPQKARETLLPLVTRYGLDGGLAVEKRILGLACPPEQRGPVRDLFVGLQRLESGDAVRALDLVKDLPQPLVVMQAFAEVRAVGTDVTMTLGDLGQAIGLARQGGLQEMCDAVVTLRKADPTMNDYYDRSKAVPLAAALKAIAGGATPSLRAATLTRLAAAIRASRSADSAVALDAKLLAANPALSEEAVAAAFVPVLSARGRDEEILAIAAAGLNRPRFEEELRGARAAQGSNLYHGVLLTDLKALQAAVDAAPTVGLAEAAGHLKTLREGARSGSDVVAPLAVVVGGADEAERKRRATAAARLLAVEEAGPAAGEDLQWILDDPAAKADPSKVTEPIPSFDERVDRFVDLRKYARAEDRAAVKEVYERILSDGLVEQRGWLSRLFRRPRRMLNLVYSLINLGGDTGRAARYVRAVEQGRFEGETLRASFKRFKKLFEYSEGDSSERLAGFFERLRAPVAWGPGDDDRWKTARDLVKTSGSTRHAGAIWKAMAEAPTREEAQARRQAWFDLRALTDRYAAEHVTGAFEAVAETCGQGAITVPLAEMRGLVEKQGPQLAAKTWRRSLTLCATAPAELARVRSVLSGVRDDSQHDLLAQRLETVVAAEPLSFRAQLLDEVMGGQRGLAVYDAAVEALKGDGLFEPLGRSYASLVSMLSRSRRDASAVARDTLEWVKKEHASDPEGLSVSDMFMELSASLLLKPDLDSAKAGLRAKREMLRKARQGTQTVSAGSGEVNLGGIRVKVRKDDAPQK